MSGQRISYEYYNRSSDIVEIWLSVAPDTTDIQFSGIQPVHIDNHQFLGAIYYFKVPSQQSIQYTARYERTEKPLCGEEREYFLKNTTLIPVNEMTRQKALRIIEGDLAKTVKDKVYSIFNYVKKNFKYSSSERSRGFVYTTTKKKGDCGELSAVIASYCRSIGIPCRIMIGAFKGKDNHHAWNEVYIPEEGWIPLDVTLAIYTFFRYPIHNVSSGIKWGAFTNKKRYFGKVEQGRVVFSIDPERYLMPRYQDSDAPVDDMTFQVAGKKFAWGIESIGGCAPYMQPIYPKLNHSYKIIKGKDVLGSFAVSSLKLRDRMSYKIKINSFLIGSYAALISVLLSFIKVKQPMWFVIILNGGIFILFTIFGVTTIIRREINWPVIFISLFFLLAGFGTIFELLT